MLKHIEILDNTDYILHNRKENILVRYLKEKEKELASIDLKLKQLIENKEEKDEKFDREKFYEYFKTTSDNQMTYKQKEEAIKLLEVK